jgi:3-oxoacyl-[acyl-carrier-protein] synthase II
MRKRLVITGMGVVTPIGVGTESYWAASIEGRTGVREITSFDVSNYPSRIAAEVKAQDFDPQDYFDKKDIAMMGKSIQFALAAAQMAMSDSLLNIDKLNPVRTGISMGVTEEFDDYIYSFSEAAFKTSYVEAGQKQRDMKKFAEYCRKAEKPYRGFITSFPDFVTTEIASTYNILGPCLAVDTACAAGAQAIGDACRIIESGEADVMICGGTESLAGPNILLMFSLLNAISTNNTEPEKASRPFDAKRDGFVLGEGAGILIVESLEHALKRDARIHGEIIGFGVSCDAYRVTDEPPDGRGAIQSMRNALEDAGVRPEEVDYINAHGTSTQINDKVETFAIKQVFGEHAFKIPISSSKSMIGHLIAGAGAVELITSILTMGEGIIPPTINYQFPDPDCDLDYVPNKARKGEVNITLSNSFGFGGQNVSLLVKKYSDS